MVLRESPIAGTQVQVRAYSRGERTQTDSGALFGAHPRETRPRKASEGNAENLKSWADVGKMWEMYYYCSSGESPEILKVDELESDSTSLFL